MGKEDKNNIDTGIPDDAFKVTEIGRWAVFFSESKASIYFTSPSCPSPFLRLSKDELLMLAQGMETWRPVEKAVAAAPQKDEVPSAGNSRDKRRFRRFTRRCEAEFTAGGVSNRGIASDFSINGLFMRTNHPFAADTVIDIMVHLPDRSVSSLQGKVKRAMKTALGRVMGTPIKEYKNGMGVELTQKDANYLHFIRSLIK
jgi:hypothetical protein